uniref:Uncharacterized protein n=1 Tax=Anguilla anguilla TaxID=7936 RepID=A0A0E9V4U9_ANGAN
MESYIFALLMMRVLFLAVKANVENNSATKINSLVYNAIQLQ